MAAVGKGIGRKAGGTWHRRATVAAAMTIAAVGITAAVTLLVGVLPNIVLHFGDLSTLVASG